MSSLNDFEILRKLGEGTYSTVYKVRRITDNNEYAMKRIKMQKLTSKEQENAINEVRFLASIKHANIISYKEAIFDEPSASLYIIMEYMPGGDLLNKIRYLKKKNRYFEEPIIWSYLIQLIKALKQLHDLHILHRDLKCANVFLSRDHKVAKLGDLNVSKIAKMGMLYTQTGTPYYASPEVWRDKPYDFKSDIWSLGCVLYEICCLKTPFKAQDMETLYKRVQKGIYDPIPSWYSQDLQSVIAHCLQVLPQQRPSTDQLLGLAAVKKRIDLLIKDNFFPCSTNNEEEFKADLLKTIQIPKNFKGLGDVLPRPNYRLLNQLQLINQNTQSSIGNSNNNNSNGNINLNMNQVNINSNGNNNPIIGQEKSEGRCSSLDEFKLHKLAQIEQSCRHSNNSNNSNNHLNNQQDLYIKPTNFIEGKRNVSLKNNNNNLQQSLNNSNSNGRSRSIESLISRKVIQNMKINAQQQQQKNNQQQQSQSQIEQQSIPIQLPLLPQIVKSQAYGNMRQEHLDSIRKQRMKTDITPEARINILQTLSVDQQDQQQQQDQQLMPIPVSSRIENKSPNIRVILHSPFLNRKSSLGVVPGKNQSPQKYINNSGNKQINNEMQRIYNSQILNKIN